MSRFNQEISEILLHFDRIYFGLESPRENPLRSASPADTLAYSGDLMLRRFSLLVFLLRRQELE